MKQHRTQDIALYNRQLVVQSILNNGALSRIEIAEKTNLSSSTVTRVVANLMTRGVLAEDTRHIRTIGRSRIPLIINKDFGTLAIIQISCSRLSLYLFDMSLSQLYMSSFNLDGCSIQDLVNLTCEKLSKFKEEGFKKGVWGQLKSLGILYESKKSSSEILSPALSPFTQNEKNLFISKLSQRLDVPIFEEEDSSGIEQLLRIDANCIDNENSKTLNHAAISFGSKILLTVMQDGEPVVFKEGIKTDITSQVFGSGETEAQIVENLFHSISLIGTLFSICSVFLLYKSTQGFTSPVERLIQFIEQGRISDEKFPELIPVVVTEDDNVFILVNQLRRNAMFQDGACCFDVY